MSAKLTGWYLYILLLIGGYPLNHAFAQINFNDEYPANIQEIRNELNFIDYCENRRNYTDAIYLLNHLSQLHNLPVSLEDTLQYKLGWIYYQEKELEKSSTHLFKVSENSSYYLKSRFFGSYNLLFLGNHASAREHFNRISTPEGLKDSLGPLMIELKALELAGIALLERNTDEFSRQSSFFTYEYYPLANEQSNLLKYKDLLYNHPSRVPWLAGIMSAVIPGSGKIYAGKTGEGIAAFLVVASLGLVGWENYRKDGLADWKTLLAGGLFSVYYSGNIIGSIKAATRTNHAYISALENRILFDLHIPLRNIFN